MKDWKNLQETSCKPHQLESYLHWFFSSNNICQAQRAHQAAKELREAVEQLSGGGLGDPKGARAFGGLCLKRFQGLKKIPQGFPH